MSRSDSTGARASWAIGGLLAIAVPVLADEPPPICAQLAALVDAARDGALHQVRLTWADPEKPPRCQATGDAAERRVCRWWLGQTRSRRPAPITMSRAALDCLGHPPVAPVSDDGEILLHAWFTAGTWHPLDDRLAREHVELTLDMDLRGDGPWWIQFTASPK